MAYLRHTGPYGQTIAEFWRDQFVPWLHAQALLPYAKYGIGHDNPQLTDPAQCRYDACVALPPGYARRGHADHDDSGRFIRGV